MMGNKDNAEIRFYILVCIGILIAVVLLIWALILGVETIPIVVKKWGPLVAVIFMAVGWFQQL